MSTTTDIAARIRVDLKTLGVTARQVSVKSDSFSGGSSIRIVIRDLDVPASVVKTVCAHHNAERIDRCEFSGDILSGCNRYLSIDFDRDALAALAMPATLDDGAIVFKDHKIVPLAGDVFAKVCVIGPDGEIAQGMRACTPRGAAEAILAAL